MQYFWTNWSTWKRATDSNLDKLLQRPTTKTKNLNKKTSGDHDRANSDKIALEALNDTIFLEGENSNCRDFIKLLKKLCNNIFYNHRENNIEN